MGLITLILLLAFVLLYLDKSIQNKPEIVTNILGVLSNNLEKLTLWGAIYAIVGIILTPAMSFSGGDVLIRVIANLMVLIMTLPFVFEKYSDKLQARTNEVVVREIGKSIAWIKSQEKMVGTVAAVLAVLLFAVVFK